MYIHYCRIFSSHNFSVENNSYLIHVLFLFSFLSLYHSNSGDSNSNLFFSINQVQIGTFVVRSIVQGYCHAYRSSRFKLSSQRRGSQSKQNRSTWCFHFKESLNRKKIVLKFSKRPSSIVLGILRVLQVFFSSKD